MSHRHFLALPLIGLAALLPLRAGHAQTDMPAIDFDSSAILADVIVTAQKIEQTLYQVTGSVSAIDGEFVRQAGSYDFVDLQNYAPNITIQMSPSSSQISMRGIGSLNISPSVDPSVGTVIDGVYYGRSSFLTAFFFDFDQMEMLRGPQGTLFGKNSTSGLLNLSTHAPIETFAASADAIYASNGHKTLRPMLNIPITDRLAVRASANLSHIDGVMFNTTLDREENNPRQSSARVRARYEPTDDWQIDLNAFHSDQRSNFNLYKLVQIGPAMRALLESFDAQLNTDFDVRQNAANAPAMETSVNDGVSATLNHDISGFWGVQNLNMTAISAYARLRVDARDLDADFSPIPFIRDTLLKPSPYEQISQELRFTGSDDSLFGWGGPIDFIAGLYYFDARFNTSDRFEVQSLGNAAAYVLAAQSDANPNQAPALGGLLGPNPPPALVNLLNTLPLPLLTPENTARFAANVLAPAINGVLGDNLPQSAEVNLDQRSRSYAVFGQLEQFFTEEWAWIGGLRLGLERKQGTASSFSNSFFIPIIADQENFEKTVDRLERDFSPRLGLKWAPSRYSGAYFTWSRGFKSGGFNGLPLNSQTLEYASERASSFEMGAKSRLLSNSLHVSSAVFWTDVKGLQVPFFQSVSPTVGNANGRTYGFEADALWMTPLPGLQLTAAVGYAHARYTDYGCAPAPADAAQTTGGSAQKAPRNCAPGTDESTSQDLTGKPLAFAPQWTASFIPAYTINAYRYGVQTTFALDVLFRDRMYLSTEGADNAVQPPTTILNLRAILAYDDQQRWSLIIGAHNLTNRIVLDQYVPQPVAPENLAIVRTDYGRYYSANLSYAFN